MHGGSGPGSMTMGAWGQTVGYMVWPGVGCSMVWHGVERVWHDRHGAEMVHHDPLCSMVLGECGPSHDPGTLA